MTAIDLSPSRSIAPAFTAGRQSSALERRQQEDAAAAANAGHPFAKLVNARLPSRLTPAQHNEKVREQVEELVAQTLIMPVLKQLQNDPLESGLFPKTHGEKSLRPLIDAEVAKDIVRHMPGDLTGRMAHRLLRPEQTTPATLGTRLDVTARRSDHA